MTNGWRHKGTEEISTRIEFFLNELSQLVKRQAIDAVHEALGETVSSRRGPGRPRKVTRQAAGRPKAIGQHRARSGKRVRRSPDDLAKLQASVLAQIRSGAGQRLEEIGRALKTDTAMLKKPVAMLLAAKKLKTTGTKRGTKYFVR